MPSVDDATRAVEQLESDVAGVLRRTRVRVVADMSKSNSKVSWHVERIGGFTMVWGTTGRLVNGTSVTFYLTENREVGGESLFRNAPLCTVTADAVGDIGGVAAATGPEKPSASFKEEQTSVSLTVAWVPGNEVWEMTVTNDTGSTKDFLVKAQGV